MSAAARRTNSRPPRGRLLWHPFVWLLALVVILIVIFYGYHAGERVAPNHPAATQPATAPPTTTDAALNQILSSWASQYSFSSSVDVIELTGSHRVASYNPASSIVPASTYKIYVAYAILHGVEQGKYTLQTTTSDGNTIQTDLNNMILNSDNDAARTLGFLYGWQNIDALLKTQGIDSTDLYNYVPPSTLPVGDKHTTAADLALTLQKLYNGQLLNQVDTQLLLGLMERQNYRQRIPAGVPSGITVADKPGWLSYADGDGETAQNDAGVVYGPKSTYVLVITTTGTSTSAVANLSTQVYNHLES